MDWKFLLLSSEVGELEEEFEEGLETTELLDEEKESCDEMNVWTWEAPIWRSCWMGGEAVW